MENKHQHNLVATLVVAELAKAPTEDWRIVYK